MLIIYKRSHKIWLLIFFINVLIMFPATSLILLLLVSLNSSFISGISELYFEYDSRALLIIGDTNPAPLPWFNFSSALFKISPTKEGTWLLPIILFIDSLILSSDPYSLKIKHYLIYLHLSSLIILFYQMKHKCTIYLSFLCFKFIIINRLTRFSP